MKESGRTTNGVGRIGRDRTLGFTSGLTNGISNRRRYKWEELKETKSRSKIPAMLVLAILLLGFGVALTWQNWSAGGIRIDGCFEDWQGIAKYTKPRNESVPENIDIAEYAIAETGKNVAFYAKVHGNLLAGDGSYIVETSTKNPVYFSTHRETAIPNGNGRDVAYVFVDTDNNQTTGFKPSVNFAVGADKAIEVVGKHGKIEISRILTFDGMNQEDWAWRVGESVPAATNGKELEIMCEKRSVEVKESYAIYLYMIDWNNTVSGVEQALRSENGKVTQFALYLSNSPPVKTEPEEMETKGTPHEPIHISGNNQFTQPNGVVGGSGTQEDPYIIEGWEIDGKGGKYCIFIENTTAYFVIRNCTVYNATADWWPPYGSGIALHNVSNGKVEKNRCNNSEYGIWVFNSSQNILITNNEVTSNRVGIHVDVSTNIIIIGNNVTNNRDDGISLAFNNCTITGNNVTNNNYGIWVTGGNHTVSENTVTNNEKGIYLEYANNCTITRNRVTHNSLDGIHIRDTENTTVMLNNASNNNRFGIFIDGGVYNQIGYNNVFSNSATGIMGYYHMRYTSITNNNVSSNSDGINITSYSTDNTITCNWVYYNTNYGLTLSYYSTNNTVLYNNFIGNNGAGRGIQGNCQACDKAGENSWYNSGTKRGNYWSNWDGTNWGTADAYPIDGGMASDWYPLPEPGFHPPIHIRSNDEFTPANGVSRGSGTPEDPYIIEGLIIDGAGGSYCIWIENTNLHFVIRNCQLQNATNSLWTPWGAGIALGNVTNGKIEGNICTRTRTGIICYGTSEFNLITENNVSQCRDGIYLSISNNNTITNNKAFNNTNSGIYLHSSANNTIRTNNVFSNSYGIYLSSSDNNTITNNEAFNNTNSGIYLYFSTNNTVGTNNVSGNYYGISLFSSAYNILSNNNVSHNLKYGFYFSSSNTNNRVAYNWIYNNTDYAIYLTYSSTGNIIHHNNIIANRGATKGVSGNCQAYDDVGGNYWYHTPERRGNYWSNWDGADWGTQNAYPIDGGMASDWYPLPATGMHLPIHITSNHEFTPLNGVVGGLGTEDEPYIIEGWEVDGDGGGYCIWVENTDVYFVIRNCKLYNATEQLAPPGGVGIALNSVKNGKIEKNLCTQSIIGIRLYGSSQHNTLVGNIGIGNTQKGLELYSSTNNTINDNQFSSNSYGVYLSSSSNNTLTKIKATNNSYGIYLSSSSTNILSSNYVCSNNIGFYLTSSSSIYIANNNVSFNSFGLYLAFSNNNEILYNWICSNTNYGVYLTSSTGNNIHHNNFIGNRESITASLKGVSGMCQAYDNSPGNYWYDAALQEGNYWSNWDGQGWGTPNAYPIDGGMASDLYPLATTGMHSPIHITSNSEFTPLNGVIGGLGTEEDPYIIGGWKIDANGGSFCIWIENTTAHFVIKDCNLSNATNTLVAPYGAAVAFNNVRNGKIENTVCTQSRYGVYLASSNFNTIANSNLSSNYYGSYLYSSTNNTIINTNFGRNSYGIYAETSANNTLLYNWILNNTNYGIYLSSSTGNYIHHNNLIGNRGTSTVSLKGVSGSSQAYDNSPGNYWYLNALQEGNYWSNWDGQGWGTQNAYPIDGGIAGDFYPIPIPGMHAPIHITSNAEFTPANGVTGGSGTYRDPYIIANWTINAKGGSYCIWIENTSLYFTIRNCNVYNATGSNGPNGAGIAFNNVTNGKIESCSSNNSRYGLLLDGFSQFNTITSNNLSRNTQTGILLSSSSNNTLTNNKISTNPIGVQLNFSSNNTIINNNVSENGRGISLFYSNDNSITHNNASRNDEYGIYLEKSSYNLLSNNTVTGSKAYASIALYYSTSNNITSNNASYSGYGIYLYRSTNNNITFNWILENTLYGIYITSSSTANYIYHNYFIRNGGNPFTSIKGVLGKSQAYDDVGGNYWHNNTLQEGNYWSNWDGQDWGKPEAYPIDGGMASDWYPIGSPVSEFSRFSVVALIVLWLFVLHIGVRKRQK